MLPETSIFVSKLPFLPHFSSIFFSIFHPNLAKMCKKHEKSQFRPAFGMCSTQALFKIYNHRPNKKLIGDIFEETNYHASLMPKKSEWLMNLKTLVNFVQLTVLIGRLLMSNNLEETFPICCLIWLVVYFDQQTGAAHLFWTEYNLFLFFHFLNHVDEKKKKNSAKTSKRGYSWMLVRTKMLI